MTDENKTESVKMDGSTIEKTPYIIVAENNTDSRDIEIRNLTVRLPGHNGATLIDDLTLTLEKGSRIVLTGPSGCGKSTATKALLNQWDYGSGLVIMPKGAKIMSLSQNAYFANTTLRGILNMKPEDKCTFEDRELTAVLKAVGHDKLIQHIPGQQVELMMNDLLAELPEKLRAFAGRVLDEKQRNDIRALIAPLVRTLTGKQFDVVQYVPETQKQYLREKLAAVLTGDLAMKARKTEVAALADAIIEDINIALVQPLYKHLIRPVPEIARRSAGWLIRLTPAQASFLTQCFEKALDRKLKDYRENKDTDDQDRPIRINEVQADHIAKAVANHMGEQMKKYTGKGFLSRAFGALASPVSLVGAFRKASAIAATLRERLTFFMDRQVLTGDKLTLSGGERQKLLIAMILLHKPDILFLDEITAALDRQTGESLYKEMMEKIPTDTTVISIAHNEHIIPFHTHHARMENKTITLTPVERPEGRQEVQRKPEGPRL